jgi:hypothetical protein
MSKKVKRFGSGPVEFERGKKKTWGRSLTAGQLTSLGVGDAGAKDAVVIKRSDLDSIQVWSD